MLAHLRLYQLISPSLPIGAFTYSQGLEWAVEAGWVKDQASLQQWLEGVLHLSVARLELPVLIRLRHAMDNEDVTSILHWSRYLYASRETSELRAEERQRGKALGVLLPSLGIEITPDIQPAIDITQLAGMALASHHWRIPIEDLCTGYLWSWLENSVMAGVKLVPLGQTSGQRVLLDLSEQLPELVELSLSITDEHVAGSTPALAIASARHETQYTRLFRS